MYQVIATLKNWNPEVKGTQIKVEPFWIAKSYKTVSAALKFAFKQNEINPKYKFRIEKVA